MKRHQQYVFSRLAKGLEQTRGQQWRGIDSLQRRLRCIDYFEPGCEQFGVSDRGVEDAIIAAASRFAIKHDGMTERRAAIHLVQFAIEQQTPIAAAHVRNGIEPEIFLDQVN